MNLAAAGEHISHARAKEILGLYSDPTPDAPAGSKLPKVARLARPDARPFERDAAAWRVLEVLAGESRCLRLEKVNDDEFGDEVFAVTVIPERPDGSPRTVVRKDPDIAVLATAGNEPGKQCLRCQEHRPFSAFSYDTQVKDGRCRYCRSCESKRAQKRQRVRTGSPPELKTTHGEQRHGREPDRPPVRDSEPAGAGA